MPVLLLLSLLLASLHLSPVSPHACDRAAEHLPFPRAFLSTCHGAHGRVAASGLHEAALFVCLPLAPPPGPLHPGLDALSRTLSPDAFAGRLHRENSETASDLYALSFEETSAVARGKEAAYSCTRAWASGLEPGEYTAEVVHEHSNWDWDPVWKAPRPGPEDPVFGTALANWSLVGLTLELEERTLSVLGSSGAAATARRALPECTSEELHGTFREGRFHASSCTRRLVSHAQFKGCMASLGGRVAVMGDSNSRRAMKLLMSGGEWCAAPGDEDRSHCACEDSLEDVPVLLQPWHSVIAAGVDFPNGAALAFEQYGGFPSNVNFFVSQNATIAVLGYLGAWPEAALNVTEYVSKLAELVNLLMTLPPTMRIIFRSAPHFCGFAGAFHRFSDKRQKLFTSLMRSSMLGAFPGRAYFWDTRSVSEAVPMKEVGHHAMWCRSNHLGIEMMREDLATLMHLICHIAQPG